jgi:hypothetical protein
MKLSLAVISILSMVLFLYPSEGYSQQQQAGPSTASPNSNGQRNRSTGAPLAQRGQTIRIIGSPTLQPSRGLGIECTPVEQEIVGLIIGPTNLCDR